MNQRILLSSYSVKSEALEGRHHSGEFHDIFLCGGTLHVSYGVDFDRVSLDTMLADHKIQELSRGDTKNAPGQVKLPPISSKVSGRLAMKFSSTLVFTTTLSM